MTATMNDEMVTSAVDQERINKFVMPKPKQGQQILWYRHGIKMSGPNGVPELAYALRVGDRNLRIQTGDGMVYHAVPHIEDPRLGMNEFQRQNGAWDFTEEHNFFVNTAETILSRMATMEKRIQELKREIECLQPKKLKGNANEVL